MLTAACLALLIATLALTAWCGHEVGRTRRPRSENYLAARAALRRQLEEVTADRDRLNAALDEMGKQHDLLVRRVAAIHGPQLVRTVPGAEVYDHQEAGL